MAGQDITRDQLADLLNEDLSREYQAIIAYVVYSQVLKGAEYMNIAAQLEEHAHQELQHALTISRQIDYLGKMPSVTPKPVKTSDKARDMLKFDLDNENLTILNYQERIRQCEALSEFAMAEQIQRNSRAGAGPPDRFGHGSRRGRSGRQQTAQAQELTSTAIFLRIRRRERRQGRPARSSTWSSGASTSPGCRRCANGRSPARACRECRAVRRNY